LPYATDKFGRKPALLILWVFLVGVSASFLMLIRYYPVCTARAKS